MNQSLFLARCPACACRVKADGLPHNEVKALADWWEQRHGICKEN